MARNGPGGKTPHSFRKHEELLQVIRGQCHAQYARTRYQAGPIFLIDLTAGDGKGVPLPQPDLFLGIVPSRTTPEILYTVGQELPKTTLVLCESHTKRRRQLAETFPSAQILTNSALAPTVIPERVGYALVVSDPNGMHHNWAAMQALTDRVPRSDFVLTLNELAIKRVLGGGPDWEHHPTQVVRGAFQAQAKYRWMLDPQAWRQCLRKRQVAQTRHVIKASQDFHYRIVVVAHTMSDVIKRHSERWELFT